MKRFLVCAFCVFMLSLPVFAITTTDDFEISAYKNVGATGSWVKVEVKNLSNKTLGPGRDLKLGDGSAWVGAYADAFSFEITGNNAKRVEISFEFENFAATDTPGTQITGNVRFKESGFISDYGSPKFPDDGFQYWEYGRYTYKEEWPSSSDSSKSLQNGVLEVSGVIKRKRGNGNFQTNFSDAIQQYTRTGIVQLKLDKTSYDAAPYEKSYTSTVRVTCMVD